MKRLYTNILSILGVESSRTKNITKHVLLSAIYKGGHIIATFLLVPLTIDFLDTENYGVWLTLSSFIAWFSFFDIGLGNGLRNKFAEARAKNDMELARGYVSTAYFTIGSICLAFFLISLIIGYFVDWTRVFNTSIELKKELRLLMPIVFGSFSLQLIVKLIAAVYTADQNHSISGKISFITAATSLLMIWFLTHTSESSLLLFGSIFSFLPVLVFLIFNLYAFTGRYKDFVPRTSYWRKEYFNDIFGLGLSFFIIQISVVVLTSTDSFIITQLFNPEAVVPYYIAHKYMSVSYMIFVLILTPYWSSITQAFVGNEFEWIKTSMKSLVKFSVGICIFICILVISSALVYEVWLGDKVTVPFELTLSMAVYFLIMILIAPFTFFLNGIGKIKIQMILTLFAAVINIPLSIILVKYFGFGTNGVIIATIIGMLPNLIFYPIQYKRLINSRATGLWNK